MAGKRLIVSAIALVAGVTAGALFMLRGTAPAAVLTLPAPAPVTFYHWSDAEGAKHITSEPPPSGVAYETTITDGVLTRMDAPRPREPAPTEVGNPLSVYSPGGMKQLVENAGNAAQAVNQAREQQRHLIEQQ